MELVEDFTQYHYSSSAFCELEIIGNVEVTHYKNLFLNSKVAKSVYLESSGVPETGDSEGEYAIILSAKFATEEFGSDDDYIKCENIDDKGYVTAIVHYLKIKFPSDWPKEEWLNVLVS